jgi:16S rRNA (uracil1498-N3)-methyltransferase
MPETRLYIDLPLAPGGTVELHDDRARYVSKVLRLRPGDRITLFDGRGAEYVSTIEALRKGVVTVAVVDRLEVIRESPLQIHLLQGVSRGERMDFVVQKATELGVARMTPVLTEYSVVKLNEKRAARKLTHWRGVAASACEQCGRNVLPLIDAPIALRNWMGDHADGRESRIVLVPGATSTVALVNENRDPAGTITALVGPEGGLSEAEIELATACRFHPIAFGPRTLRTETAAIALLASLQTLQGDLA